MGGEDAGAGMRGEGLSIEAGEPPEGVGVEHGRPGELPPQPADDPLDGFRAAKPRADGQGIGPAGEGSDRLEGVAGEGAVGPGREGVGHDAGVKAGGDRRRSLWSGQIDQARPAAEGRHGRQSRGPCHAGRPAHHEHPAIVAFARIPLPDGKSGEVVGGWKRKT